VRPSWAWLATAGLVAGGPTFIGAMVGYGTRRLAHTELGLYMLGVGFLLGIATDLVVAYGGA
jgi:hypothetical protein